MSTSNRLRSEPLDVVVDVHEQRHGLSSPLARAGLRQHARPTWQIAGKQFLLSVPNVARFLLKDGDQISIVPAIAGGAEESVPRARATASTVIGDGCVKYDSRAGWCYENQTMSREAIPAALNNHQAFGSSKLGMAGGYNGGGTR